MKKNANQDGINNILFLFLEKNKLLKMIKCIKPIFPRGDTAVFLEDVKTKVLKGPTMVQDDPNPRAKDETGYVSMHLGDSGAPFWVPSSEFGHSDKDQNILIALYKGSFRTGDAAHGSISNNKEDQCRMISTKISEDVVKWIKGKAGVVN